MTIISSQVQLFSGTNEAAFVVYSY